MTLVVLIGASRSGKTTIAQAVEAKHAGKISVHYFDHIGVPSVEQMIADYGSPARWQYAMTVAWMKRLAALAQSQKKLLFEGQMRLAFVTEAAETAGISCRSILIDCDDDTRRHRLAVDRGQPELANDEMIGWAAFLRREAITANAEILDTSSLSLDESVAAVIERLSQ